MLIKRTIVYDELVRTTHEVEVELPYENLNVLEQIADETDLTYVSMDDVLDYISNKVKIVKYKENIATSTDEIEWVDDYDSGE